MSDFFHIVMTDKLELENFNIPTSPSCPQVKLVWKVEPPSSLRILTVEFLIALNTSSGNRRWVFHL